MDKGASDKSDRAVVNGAASVSAVPASVPSADMPWSRHQHRRFVCECRLCQRSREFDGHVSNLRLPKKQFFIALLDELCEVEDERDYLRAILDGSWPQSVEILQKRLAQAIEARRAETQSGSVHESAVRQDAPETSIDQSPETEHE